MTADGEDGRGLDTLGDCHAGIEPPPMFEVGDEIRCRREICGDKSRSAADIFFERVFRICPQDVLGETVLLGKGAEEVVVVRVADGVALSLVDILRVGQLRARHDVDDALRDRFASVNLGVQIAGEIVDLIFPKIGERGEKTCQIAVEGGIADRAFRLVPVAGKAVRRAPSSFPS